MRHIVFQIPTPWGHIPIMGYGLMIVLGFLCGIALAHWRAKRCGENPEHVMNLGLLSLLGGIGGARLLYVLGDLDSFTGRGLVGNVLAMLNVRAGGLVYYGGLLVAVGLALAYISRKKLSTRRMLDIVAPLLMLGLAFGRAGCTLNGCCWGGKCTFEKPVAQKLLTMTFPFASPAFDQQAERMPWQIVNADGQEVGLYERNERDCGILQAKSIRSLGGRVDWVHVPVPEFDGPEDYRTRVYLPDQPYLRVPVALLRPHLPKLMTEQTWRVVNSKGDVLGCYPPSPNLADRPRKFLPATSPDTPGEVDLPADSVIDSESGPEVMFSFLDRETIGRAADPRLAELASEFPSEPVYPVQLYGIANALLLCWVLTIFFPRRRREGQVFALMLILYPISRFLLEGVRKDTDPVFLWMTLSQTISLFVFAAGLLVWWTVSRLPAVARVPSSGLVDR